MRDTPRTDKLARGNHVVPTEWAEDLEREVNQLRQALRGIQQLAQGHSDKIVLLANVAEIARLSEDALKESPPASHEQANIRRLESLGFLVASGVEYALAQNGGDRKTSDEPTADACPEKHLSGLAGEQRTEARVAVTSEKPIELVLKKLESERGQLREALQAVMDWNPKPEETDRPQTVARFEADMERARKTLEITK